jgi:hypothetical protein
MPIREWKPALNRFAIEFEDRFPKGIILWHKTIDRSKLSLSYQVAQALLKVSY